MLHQTLKHIKTVFLFLGQVRDLNYSGVTTNLEAIGSPFSRRGSEPKEVTNQFINITINRKSISQRPFQCHDHRIPQTA